MSTNGTLYDEDFYAWTQQQATLLRKGAVQDLDLANLAEEIESLGKSQQHVLESRLEKLVLHLLKWHYQPSGRVTGHSWYSTIAEHRRQIAAQAELRDRHVDLMGGKRRSASSLNGWRAFFWTMPTGWRRSTQRGRRTRIRG